MPDREPGDFDEQTQDVIGHYVYALFDPEKPNVPFYIGKGYANRVFSHAVAAAAMEEGDAGSAKLNVIRAIRARGKTVTHKVLRYGLSSPEALRVEALAIELVNLLIKPNRLTNEVAGHGVDVAGQVFVDAADLAAEFNAKKLDPQNAKLLLIKIDRNWTSLLRDHDSTAARIPPEKIFEATRGSWVVSETRAQQATFVLSVARGLVRAVYKAASWNRTEMRKRREFVAEPAGPEDSARFIGKSVKHFFRRGGQNPIRYINCPGSRKNGSVSQP